MEVENSTTGFLPYTCHAASLERLIGRKSEIEAAVGGPFRLVQVGHWCNTQSAREWPIFLGHYGKRVRKTSEVEEYSKRVAN